MFEYLSFSLSLSLMRLALTLTLSSLLIPITINRRDTILKVLKEVDPSYGSCATSVIAIVKKELKNSFGFDLSSRFLVQDSLDIKGVSKAKLGSEFILFNGLLSSQLQDILSDSASVKNKAWMGFVFVVLQIINSSTAKTIDSHTLLSKIREVDNRFPESIAQSSPRVDVPVPELGEDFTSLMKRMVTERYVVVKTNKKEQQGIGEDCNKTYYTFGARYYAEFGQRQAIVSFYQTLNQRVDSGMLQDAARAEQEMHDKIEEGSGGRGEERRGPAGTGAG